MYKQVYIFILLENLILSFKIQDHLRKPLFFFIKNDYHFNSDITYALVPPNGRFRVAPTLYLWLAVAHVYVRITYDCPSDKIHKQNLHSPRLRFCIHLPTPTLLEISTLESRNVGPAVDLCVPPVSLIIPPFRRLAPN